MGSLSRFVLSFLEPCQYQRDPVLVGNNYLSAVIRSESGCVSGL
jgi:hypothetical protein